MGPEQLTALMRRAETSDAAREELLGYLSGRLQPIAHHLQGQGRRDPALQTTALVNQALLRLLDCPKDFDDSTHLLRWLAAVMRNYRSDFARRLKKRAASGVDSQVADHAAAAAGASVEDADLMLRLDRELDELRKTDPEAARIFEVRYFGQSDDPPGALMSVSEVVRQTGLSRYRVDNAWDRACLHLRFLFGERGPNGSSR
jgi:RNA polymerase sigma factor (sigma-70 family)